MADMICREEITETLRKDSVPDRKIDQCIRLLEENGFMEGISSFYVINKGMTNKLFYFKAEGKEYLIRVPGEGTEYLLDRTQEVAVYRELADENITDKIVCIDPVEGFKITEYIAGVHNCNVADAEEVRRCMLHLKALHDKEIKTEKEFDPFEMLEHYECSCRHDISDFVPEYSARRKEINELREIINRLPRRSVLCHVDPVYDNFLVRDGEVHLIDWEYAAQADPDMDIAMFCIYAGYDKEEIDRVTDMYYPEGCDERHRIKIYGYIACSALLWVVWCEIKRDSGVLFDEYEKQQYEYVHKFYELAKNGFLLLNKQTQE